MKEIKQKVVVLVKDRVGCVPDLYEGIVEQAESALSEEIKRSI